MSLQWSKSAKKNPVKLIKLLNEMVHVQEPQNSM